jgi:hypothetical protein
MGVSGGKNKWIFSLSLIGSTEKEGNRKKKRDFDDQEFLYIYQRPCSIASAS